MQHLRHQHFHLSSIQIQLGLTRNSHSARIATKGGNVPLYPVQSSSLIQKSSICHTILYYPCPRQEPKHPQSILNFHINNIPIRCVNKCISRRNRLRTTKDKTASMEENYYREMVGHRIHGNENVEDETIF